MFVYSVHPYSVSSCAPSSAENWALRAAVTLSSSQWLENYKRGQWALSCLQVKMSLHWLVRREVYRAICKLPLTFSCSGRHIRTVCIWKCTWVCNNWLFIQPLQSHAVVPLIHHLLPPDKPYVGHSSCSIRGLHCDPLRWLSYQISVCLIFFFNHNHVSQTVITLWLQLQEVDWATSISPDPPLRRANRSILLLIHAYLCSSPDAQITTISKAINFCTGAISTHHQEMTSISSLVRFQLLGCLRFASQLGRI